MVGVGVTVVVTIFGGLLGMLAGYFGGWIDSIISRIIDIFFGLPFLLGSMVILNAFTERKVYVVIAALAFLGWTTIARVMRSSVITAKQADYVTAARALGAGTQRILFRRVLPNAHGTWSEPWSHARSAGCPGTGSGWCPRRGRAPR